MKTVSRTDITSTIPREFEKNPFTIAVNSQSFHVLLDSLYTNKVRAVIRELWTNAADSHIEAGVPDAAFDCQLPTALDPVFRVRDYGVSLSHKDVLHLYTTVFASTKTDTNDQVGCLGLGSKSPFAYTDAFQVTAWLDGEKRTYLCALDPDGVPSITHVGTEASGDPRGFEVSFPVQSQHQHEFAEEAALVARGFRTSPLFTGVQVSIQEPILTGDSWAVYPATENAVRQGCVVYPVTSGQLYINNKLQGDHGIVVDVPIGTVEIAASREALSLDDETKHIVRSHFETAIEEIKYAVLEDVRNATSLLEAQFAYAKASKFVALGTQFYNGKKGDPHAIQLSGYANLAYGKSYVPTIHNPTGRKVEYPNFPVEDIAKVKFIVTRSGKTPRVQLRIKKYRDSLPYDGRARLFLLKDPTPKQLNHLTHALGLVTEEQQLRGTKTRTVFGCPQIIPAGSLPDVEVAPRSPREKREPGTGPRPDGAYSYKGKGNELDQIKTVPSDYYWIPITGALHHSVSIGSLGSFWRRGTAFETVHYLAAALDITKPVLFLTPTAQKRLKPSTEATFEAAVIAARDQQRDEILYKVALAEAFSQLNQQTPTVSYDRIHLLVEPIAGDGDLSGFTFIPDRVKRLFDGNEIEEAQQAGTELAERVIKQFPIFFKYEVDESDIREYVTARSAR